MVKASYMILNETETYSMKSLLVAYLASMQVDGLLYLPERQLAAHRIAA